MNPHTIFHITIIECAMLEEDRTLLFATDSKLIHVARSKKKLINTRARNTERTNEPDSLGSSCSHLVFIKYVTVLFLMANLHILFAIRILS